MDRTKYQFEGMKWLVELELLNHPQAINTIKLNIMMVSKRIKEAELLIYRENKSVLVLLDLTWIGRKFYKRKIFVEVQDVLSQLLPTFRFRVTDDPKIMEMAVERVKQALTGGTNENSFNPSTVPSKLATEQQSGSGSISQSGTGVSNDLETNSKEQSSSSDPVSNESSQVDSKEKPKT